LHHRRGRMATARWLAAPMRWWPMSPSLLVAVEPGSTVGNADPGELLHQDAERFGPTVNRQPPGKGNMSMLFSYSSHSSSATGSRLIARRTGSGTGAAGGGGVDGAIVALATVATVDRRVSVAPQAVQVRPPWFTASQTPHRQIAVTGIAAFPACREIFRRACRTRHWPRRGSRRLRCQQLAPKSNRVGQPKKWVRALGHT
jgi:hypothetical protein